MSNLKKDRMKRMMVVISYFLDKFEYENQRFMPISTETLLEVLNYSEVDAEELNNIEAIFKIISKSKSKEVDEETISIIFSEMLQIENIKKIKSTDGLNEFLELYLEKYNQIAN